MTKDLQARRPDADSRTMTKSASQAPKNDASSQASPVGARSTLTGSSAAMVKNAIKLSRDSKMARESRAAKKPASSTQLEPTPATLAKRARDTLTQGGKTYLETLRNVGEILVQAKALVGHGGYERWVEEKCKFQKRAAANYVFVYRNWAKVDAHLDANPHDDADLTLTAFLKLVGKSRRKTRVDSRRDDALTVSAGPPVATDSGTRRAARTLPLHLADLDDDPEEDEPERRATSATHEASPPQKSESIDRTDRRPSHSTPDANAPAKGQESSLSLPDRFPAPGNHPDRRGRGSSSPTKTASWTNCVGTSRQPSTSSAGRSWIPRAIAGGLATGRRFPSIGIRCRRSSTRKV